LEFFNFEEFGGGEIFKIEKFEVTDFSSQGIFNMENFLSWGISKYRKNFEK